MAEKVGSIYYDLDLDDKKFKDGVSRTKGLTADLGTNMADVAKKTVTAIAGIGIAMGGVAKIALDSASNFENLGVALKTSFQGNVELAQQAQKTITDFSAKTPFQIEEVMTAFIKLKNMGLDPSEKALTSYGDTASAMGKSLNQMTEAVADAITGEFERLKEFGIRASSEGDNVTFTFQGVSKTVKKNSKEIEKYLIELGQTKFAGGMEAQSQTLSGRLSTLKDEFDLLTAEFAEKSGLMDLAKMAVEFLSEQVGNLTPKMQQLGTWVEQVKIRFSTFKTQIDAVGGILEFLKLKISENQEKFAMIAGAIAGVLIPVIISLAVSIISATAPIVALIAVGALLGLGIQAVANHFGGFRNVIDNVRNAFINFWNFVSPFIMPLINQLTGTVQKLIPQLQQLWNTISPLLVPALKVIGAVIGGVVIVAIGAMIHFVNSIITGIYGFVSAINALISKAKSGFESVRQYFQNMADYIMKNVDKVKNALNKINPFARFSPSLVDNVGKGTGVILKQYESMFDKVSAMSGQTRLALNASVQTGGLDFASKTNPVSINVDNYYGDQIGLTNLAERLMTEMNNIRRSRG